MAFVLSAGETAAGAADNVDMMTGTEALENLGKLQDVELNQVLEYFKGKVPDLVSFGMTVLLALVVYFIGTRLMKLLRRLIRRSLTRSQVDVGVVQFADAFVRVISYAVLFLIIIGFFGIETTSFIAVFGSAGLAIGLAVEGSLANFAGGVLILALKPFVVGDYIVSGANEGTVTEISLFATKLLTIDNRAVIVPNGQLSNSTITNATNEDFRRLDLSVGISYQADLLQAKDVLRAIYEEDEAILKDRPIQIFVDELGDSAVKLGARGWVEADGYWEAKWRITEKIKLRFDAEGIEIPYNQMDVHIHTEKNEKI